MIIIHGDDTISSYRKFSSLLENFSSTQKNYRLREAGDLDITSLRQEMGEANLFGESETLIIKNLLSSPKSKTKDAIIKFLQSEDGNTILYEPKKVSDTTLKQFSQAKIETFNLSSTIFKFLDHLRPGNQRQILLDWENLLEAGNEPEYIFAMLVRQIRLLIQAKSGSSYLKLSPYPQKLIISQATSFDLSHLLDLHQFLYQIDLKIKTGLSPLPIDQLLFQFLLKI